MKYSFGLDVCCTVAVWSMFGFSLIGLLIAVVVGTMASAKLATGWDRCNGTAMVQRLWFMLRRWRSGVRKVRL